MDILYGKSNEIKDFWNLMGPLFASRDMVKIQGVNMYDSDSTLWFLSVNDNRVNAFCAAQITHGGKAILKYDHANKGQGAALGSIRRKRTSVLKTIQKITILERTVHHSDQSGWIKKGFQFARKNGQYVVLNKEIIK